MGACDLNYIQPLLHVKVSCYRGDMVKEVVLAKFLLIGSCYGHILEL